MSEYALKRRFELNVLSLGQPDTAPIDGLLMAKRAIGIRAVASHRRLLHGRARFEEIREHHLAAGLSAVHVVDGTREEDSGSPRRVAFLRHRWDI
jgi:hypothetical protein